MAYAARVLHVLIASPGDVPKERQIAIDVIHKWNSMHAEDKQAVLMPLAWETDSAPAMGDRAQGILNKQLVDRADILIGIFWTRLGTPTGEAESGTAEEIERHVGAGKPAMLYFSHAPVVPDSIDLSQYARLKEFREEVKLKGLIESYDNLAEFSDKLLRHLVNTVNTNSYIAETAAIVADFEYTDEAPKPLGQPADLPMPALSDEAEQLLIEASESNDGHVLMIRASGGLVVQTNGKGFVPDNSPRAAAKWEKAVKELLNDGLLQDVGYKGEIFSVTDEGYEVADRLKAKGK